MKLIKQIIHKQMGNIQSHQLVELIREHSELPLVIKWACAPRECHPASQIIKKIKEGEPADYVREVFILNAAYHKLKEQYPA